MLKESIKLLEALQLIYRSTTSQSSKTVRVRSYHSREIILILVTHELKLKLLNAVENIQTAFTKNAHPSERFLALCGDDASIIDKYT